VGVAASRVWRSFWDKCMGLEVCHYPVLSVKDLWLLPLAREKKCGIGGQDRLKKSPAV